MDLLAVMSEVGDALDTINGLRVYRYPTDSAAAPAAIVSLPETVTFDETYGRGMDRMALPVVVLIGRMDAKASTRQAAEYAAGSGDRSVKAAVEGHEYESCHTVRVEMAEFDIVTIHRVEYLGVTFTIDITGPGGT